MFWTSGDGDGDGDGDGGRAGGEDGKGRMMAWSREAPERLGREDRVCVLARRRDEQMQW